MHPSVDYGRPEAHSDKNPNRNVINKLVFVFKETHHARESCNCCSTKLLFSSLRWAAIYSQALRFAFHLVCFSFAKNRHKGGDRSAAIKLHAAKWHVAHVLQITRHCVHGVSRRVGRWRWRFLANSGGCLDWTRCYDTHHISSPVQRSICHARGCERGRPQASID
jgi:hypothetical protein